LGFMAASWVMPLSEDPPRVVAALGVESHTLSVIRECGCFSINVMGVGDRDFVYAAGVVSGRERRDKASLLGAEFSWDTVSGCPRLVRPRPLGVVEARVWRVVDDVAEDTCLVVGDVVAAYGLEGLFTGRWWDLRRVRVLLHGAGRVFTTNSGVFYARRSV